MAAMPQDDVQPFYTPAKVRQLLRDYPELGYSRPPQDDQRVRVMATRPTGAGWEEPVVRAADIEQAVRWLNERDWRAAYCVRASYIVGLSTRDIARYLARHGIPVSHETVNRWRKDGLELMSAYLCGKVG